MRSVFLSGYVLGALTIAAFLFVLLSFQAVFAKTPFALLFLLAVLVAAWRGGLGIGLLTTMGSALASAYFFMRPFQGMSASAADNRMSLGVLLSAGLALSLSTALLRKAETRALQGALEREKQFKKEIAERRRAETENRWLAAIVEFSDDAIISKTPEGVITSWNKGAERLFGYTAAEAVGLPITLIIPPDLRAETQRMQERIMHGQHIEHYETERVRKDGRRIPISLTLSLIKDEHGRLLGISMIGRDITERKRMEQTLIEADHRKNEFFAMLGHELRNPLAPIRNAVQIMGKLEGADPKLHWARAVVDRQVSHLARLVDDLLDVSRIVQGKLVLQKAPVEITAILDQAIETCRPFIDQRRHDFTVNIPKVPMRVFGDGLRLAQVVSNLLNNAAKYTPEGGRIWLTLRRENGNASISVRDNGEGIPPSLLPHIFNLFTQAERTVDRSQGGLGLGLAIVQNIVAMHGGRVEARSDGPGKGCEFEVKLPLLETGNPDLLATS